MQGLHRYRIRQYEFILILIVQEDIAVQQARHPRLRGYHRAVWSLRPVGPAGFIHFLLLLPLLLHVLLVENERPRALIHYLFLLPLYLLH